MNPTKLWKQHSSRRLVRRREWLTFNIRPLPHRLPIHYYVSCYLMQRYPFLDSVPSIPSSSQSTTTTSPSSKPPTSLTQPPNKQQKEAHKTLKLEHATLRKTNTALRTANSGLNQAVRSMTVSQRQLQAGNKALEVKLKELTGIDSGGGGGGVKASARPLKTETISRVRKQPGSGKGGLKGK